MQMTHPSEKVRDNLDWLIWVFIVICLIYRIYIIYFPFSLFHYLVPPGDDAINHLKIIEGILSGNFSSTYPMLFHIMIAYPSKLFHIDPLRFMKWFTPTLVALPSIAIFVFLRKNFGRFAALVGFTIALLSSNYALVAFGDGNYPNILAAGFFLPLCLMYLTYATKSNKISNYVGVIVFAVLIAFTHHLTTALLMAILVANLIVLLLWNRREKISPGLRRLTIFVLSTLAVLAVVIGLTPVRSLFLSAVSEIFHSGGVSQGVAFIKPIEFAEYPAMIGPLVWSGGLIAIFYLIFMLSKTSTKTNKGVILFVLVWFAVTFLLSRTAAAGLPGRFAREIALPLILAMAIAISDLYKQFDFKIQKVIGLGLLGLIVSVNLVQVNGGIFASPEYFNQVVWFSRMDLAKATYIKSATNSKDVIYSNRTTPYMSHFADRTIIYDIEKQLKDGSFNTPDKAGAFVFIGAKTDANPNSNTYPFFANFEQTTAALNEIAPSLTLIHKFSDGSALYVIPEPKKKSARVR